MSNSPHKDWWDTTPPPLYVGRSPGGQEGQVLSAFPTANPINSPFSHGEHHVPPGPGVGRARGGETAAPIPFRMADAHFSPYINPPSLPGHLFPPTKPAQAESLRGLSIARSNWEERGQEVQKKFKETSVGLSKSTNLRLPQKSNSAMENPAQGMFNPPYSTGYFVLRGGYI